MAGRTLTPAQLLDLLASNPERIAAASAGLSERQLTARPNGSEWSANEVLAHVRSCADVWGDCITAIATRDRPTIRAINPRTWIKRTDYPNQAFGASLRAYLSQRRELLSLLETLPPQAWRRSATVTGAGAPLRRTIHKYAQWLARHERSHVRQFEDIAAGR